MTTPDPSCIGHRTQVLSAAPCPVYDTNPAHLLTSDEIPSTPLPCPANTWHAKPANLSPIDHMPSYLDNHGVSTTGPSGTAMAAWRSNRRRGIVCSQHLLIPAPHNCHHTRCKQGPQGPTAGAAVQGDLSSPGKNWNTRMAPWDTSHTAVPEHNTLARCGGHMVATVAGLMGPSPACP